MAVTVDGALARLRLDHPPLNRIDTSLLQELETELTDLRSQDAVRVIALEGTASGPFSAGADVAELLQADPATRMAFVELSQRTYDVLARQPQLTVAVLEGTAMGAGFELALACDLRLASGDGLRFGLPEVAVGLVPAGGGMKRLARMIGVTRAFELIATARVLDARSAADLGLVHLLGDGDTPWEGRREGYLRRLTELDAAAVRALKDTFATWMGSHDEEQNADERRCIEPLLRRPDLGTLLAPYL